MYSISDTLIKTYQAVYMPPQVSYEPVLESLVHISSPKAVYNLDNGKVYSSGYMSSYGSDPIKEQNEVHSGFLHKDRPKVAFIGCEDDVLKHVKEAFEATTGKELPSCISIRVMPHNKFKDAKMFYGGWSEGILGFALNSTQEIFVKENDLDILLITLGHEIGHVLTETLSSKQDEEAKAFAFEFAWVKAIQKENIAGLKGSIDPVALEPAKNGVHNVAFDYVNKMLSRGFDAFEIYRLIIKKMFSISPI